MDTLTYFSFAVSPILIFFGFIVLRYAFNLQHLTSLWNAVFLGLISVILIVISSYIIEMQWHGNYNSLRRLLFYVIVIIALSAELAKYLFLRLAFFSKKILYRSYTDFL